MLQSYTKFLNKQKMYQKNEDNGYILFKYLYEIDDRMAVLELYKKLCSFFVVTKFFLTFATSFG